MPGLGITVDMALVELPILSANVNKLEAMSRILEKTRSTNVAAKTAEYTCRNYSAEEAAAACAASRERLVAIQQGLNTVNMTETFEVDDSVTRFYIVHVIYSLFVVVEVHGLLVKSNTTSLGNCVGKKPLRLLKKGGSKPG